MYKAVLACLTVPKCSTTSLTGCALPTFVTLAAVGSTAEITDGPSQYLDNQRCQVGLALSF
jgi:hypothetical protein